MEENLHHSGDLACLCISEGWHLYDLTLLSYSGQLHDIWHVLRIIALYLVYIAGNHETKGLLCCSVFSC